jgi:hypothetical protein
MPKRTKARTNPKAPKLKKGGRGPQSKNADMAPPDEDEGRFLDLSKNPMFREMAKRENKVVIDSRFKQMLGGKHFEERPHRVDKRGRPVPKSEDNFLTRMY